MTGTLWWRNNKRKLNQIVRPNYSNLKYLGNGLNGVVFRARRQSDKQLVAIKFVKIPKTDKVTRRRLENEIKATEELNGKCAIKIFDSNLKCNPPYYVMEYLPLGDLQKLLKNVISSSSLLILFLKICKCVQECHSRDITHRDIKPENILFRKRSEPVLSDFGICKLGGNIIGTTVTEMQKRGTPLYMAPEQLRENKPQSKPADIYALGTMLHFDFLEEKIRNKYLSQDLENLINDCRATQKADRPTIEEVIQEVEEILSLARTYNNSRRKVKRIFELVKLCIERTKATNLKLVEEETRYLQQRIDEFNNITIQRKSGREIAYSVSDNWHPVHDMYSYSSETSLHPAQQKKIVLQEAQQFIKHIREYLRDTR